MGVRKLLKTFSVDTIGELDLRLTELDLCGCTPLRGVFGCAILFDVYEEDGETYVEVA